MQDSKLVPKKVVLRASMKVWGNSISEESGVEVEFDATGIEDPKELLREVHRRQYHLDVTVLNDLWLKGSVSTELVTMKKRKMDDRYKKFLQSDNCVEKVEGKQR